MPRRNPQVLIVGAGPTGLLLAAELKRRGVPCLLIDALDAPRGLGSRDGRSFPVDGDLRGARPRGAVPRPGREEARREIPLRRRGARRARTSSCTRAVPVRPRDLGGGHRVGPHRHLEDVGRRGHPLDPAGGARARPRGVVATLERDGESREVEARGSWDATAYHSVVRELRGSSSRAPTSRRHGRCSTRGSRAGTRSSTSAAFPRRPDRDPHPAARPPLARLPAADIRGRRSRRGRHGGGQPLQPGGRFVDVENPVRFQCHSRVAASFRSVASCSPGTPRTYAPPPRATG